MELTSQEARFGRTVSAPPLDVARETTEALIKTLETNRYNAFKKAVFKRTMRPQSQRLRPFLYYEERSDCRELQLMVEPPFSNHLLKIIFSTTPSFAETDSFGHVAVSALSALTKRRA